MTSDFIRSSADWAPLMKVDFTESLGKIRDFSEEGRLIALQSADVLDSSLQELYETLLATSWLGANSAENRAKAKRLLRPLRRTAGWTLPAAARRFAGLPARFRSIYEAELHPQRSNRSGIPDPRGRR